MLQDMPESDKVMVDVLSITTVTATIFDYLPAFAALLTIIWTGIRIYETDTVQKLLGKKNGNDTKP